MAQLGNTIIIGNLFVSGSVSGSISNATNDESGNNIKSSYGAALQLVDGSLVLKNKNDSNLTSIALPIPTLAQVTASGATTSTAVTFGALTVGGAVTSSANITSSGVLKVTNTTEYSSPTVASVILSGGVYIAKNVNCAGNITANRVNGAAWNDYAELREVVGHALPGQVVIENGDDTLSVSETRMQVGANLTTDMFGFIIGIRSDNAMPVAVSGRVLAYPYEDRELFRPGDAVCSGPRGTVSKMARSEIQEHPECIIGYVSCVPTYPTWGTEDVEVNGRIWIKVS